MFNLDKKSVHMPKTYVKQLSTETTEQNQFPGVIVVVDTDKMIFYYLANKSSIEKQKLAKHSKLWVEYSEHCIKIRKKSASIDNGSIISKDYIEAIKKIKGLYINISLRARAAFFKNKSDADLLWRLLLPSERCDFDRNTPIAKVSIDIGCYHEQSIEKLMHFCGRYYYLRKYLEGQNLTIVQAISEQWYEFFVENCDSNLTLINDGYQRFQEYCRLFKSMFPSINVDGKQLNKSTLYHYGMLEKQPQLLNELVEYRFLLSYFCHEILESKYDPTIPRTSKREVTLAAVDVYHFRQLLENIIEGVESGKLNEPTPETASRHSSCLLK